MRLEDYASSLFVPSGIGRVRYGGGAFLGFRSYGASGAEVSCLFVPVLLATLADLPGTWPVAAVRRGRMLW
jgi:hypothetical protein